MNEFVATLKRIAYVGGVKQELTKEATILSRDIISAYKTAISQNKGWTLDKKDIGKVVLEDPQVEIIGED